MEKKIGLEKEVMEHLKLPKCPKNEWDGKEEFAFGVAVLHRIIGTEEYAICTFNPKKHDKPVVIKDFGNSAFDKILRIYPVPAYLDEDVDAFDLDEESKEAVKEVIDDKNATISEGEKVEEEPINEWGYDFIHDKEEAIAYLKTLKLKGKIPEKEDAIKMKLQLLAKEEEAEEEENEK